MFSLSSPLSDNFLFVSPVCMFPIDVRSVLLFFAFFVVADAGVMEVCMLVCVRVVVQIVKQSAEIYRVWCSILLH